MGVSVKVECDVSAGVPSPNSHISPLALPVSSVTGSSLFVTLHGVVALCTLLKRQAIVHVVTGINDERVLLL